ncbi:hypothetical protein DPMN_109447 [Dreissena polymorpha]|uniref:Uncharacterized protein n=1 Tax=Dreissena polymorpha TaxID=45954 RepID=A0A9D4KAB2_DREPO|nr:hypothetical protein DPMN_109447 [Dreissena polymorpha]
MPTESRYSYGASVNRRSAGTPPAFTGAPSGHYRRRPGLPAFTGAPSPGLHLGITGDNRGSAGASPG